MNASSLLDARLWGFKAHQRSETISQIALEARCQAFRRRTLNPHVALRDRVVALDALSTTLLAERDQVGVDDASGRGC